MDKKYRKGKALYLFPITGFGDQYAAYRWEEKTHCFPRLEKSKNLNSNIPESRADDHNCYEHGLLSEAYYDTVRRTLKLRPEITERVEDIFDQVFCHEKLICGKLCSCLF